MYKSDGIMISNIDIRRITIALINCRTNYSPPNKVIGATCVTEEQLKGLRMIECNNDRSNKAGAE